MGGAALPIGIGLSGYSTYKSYQAEKEAARYQASVKRTDAAIKKEQIADIQFIGAQEIKRLERDAIQVGADQVTAYAGGNIDISSAVVQERLEETAKTAAADVITAQHNIEKAVWGLEVGIMSDEAQALFDSARARSLEKTAPIATGAELLTGFGGLSFSRRDKTKSPLARTSPRGTLSQNRNIAIDFPSLFD